MKAYEKIQRELRELEDSMTDEQLDAVEDYSRNENNPKRQKALEKNARRVYDNDRD